MKLSRMIEREMSRGSGQIRIVSIPADQRVKADDIRKLDREIAAHVSANEAMSNRSVMLASNRYKY